MDVSVRLQVSNEPGTRYNVPLMNALVLYVGTQAIAYIHSKSNTPSMSTITHSSHMDIFQNLAVDLDTEGESRALRPGSAPNNSVVTESRNYCPTTSVRNLNSFWNDVLRKLPKTFEQQSLSVDVLFLVTSALHNPSDFPCEAYVNSLPCPNGKTTAVFTYVAPRLVELRLSLPGFSRFGSGCIVPL